MKKSLSALLVLSISAGITGTAFAESIFADVPVNHWSYGAVNQLAKDGVLTAGSDGSFTGDRVLSRYEMAIAVARAMTKLEKATPEDQALLKKLGDEYQIELKKLDATYNSLTREDIQSNEKYKTLEDKISKIQLSGFVRAKYDSDKQNGINTNVNKHFYMNLEGKMKVDEQWDAHFQSETRDGYTANGQNWGDTQDGTFQRIWVEGKSGATGITMGKKWWGLGFQNVAFGHAADGIQFEYNFTPDVKGSIFALRPTQGDLMSMGAYNKMIAGKQAVASNSQDANIKGINIQGKLANNLEANLVLAGNDNKDKQMMDKWGSLDLRTKLGDDWTVTATYAKTNAENNDNSNEFRIDYKKADLEKVGSSGAYLRLFKFGRYGDASHDDEWASLPTDAKGWMLGYVYVPYKNVQWETFYSEQKLNISGDNWADFNYANGPVAKDAKRKLFRTQIDFHF